MPDKTRILNFDNSLCILTNANTLQFKNISLTCIDTNEKIEKNTLSPALTIENKTLKAAQIINNTLWLAIDREILQIDRNAKIINTFKLPDAPQNKTDTVECAMNNDIIFALQPGIIIAFNTDTKKIRWQIRSYAADYIVCIDENLYINEIGNTLIALRADTLKPLWKLRLAQKPYDFITHANLLLIMLKKAIYIVDPETGILQTQLPLAFEPRSFIQHNRKIYLDAENAIYNFSKTTN